MFRDHASVIMHLALLHAALAAPGCNADRPICEDVVAAGQGSNRLDVLVVADASASFVFQRDVAGEGLAAMADELLRLGSDGPGIDLHWGLVLNDLGAGIAGGGAGCPPAYSQPHMGRLRSTCLGKGEPFIRYRTLGPTQSNLPPGLALVAAVRCDPVFVRDPLFGFVTCGFEHTLEAARAVLRTAHPEDLPFLRRDALLAVLFVGNEDDCSAPADTDLFGRDRAATYGAPSYLCSRFGADCGAGILPYSPFAAAGACAAAANPGGRGPGRLFDVERYVTLFSRSTAQGGVKDRPREVALFLVGGLPAPLRVDLASDPDDTGRFIPCQVPREAAPSCVPTVRHACEGAQYVWADPSIRTGQVVNQAWMNDRTSVCEADLGPAMRRFARRLWSQLATPRSCLSRRPPGDPRACRLTLEAVGGREVELPRCEAIPGDRPCWRLGQSVVCGELNPDAWEVSFEGSDYRTRGPWRLECPRACAGDIR